MNLQIAPPASRSRFKSALRILRYISTIVFVMAFALAVIHTVPEMLRAIASLNQIKSRDMQDLVLADTLQNQLGESVEKYQQILLNSDALGFPPASLALLDRTHDIIDTSVKKLKGSDAAESDLTAFVEAWSACKIKGYDAYDVARRTNADKGQAVLRVNGANSAYLAARSATRNIKKDIQVSSERKLSEASTALQRALYQLAALLLITLACSVLFTWLESRHRKMLAELEEAHRSLNDSEERFQRAYEEAGVGMALLDLNGNLLSANGAMSELTGFDQAELLGKQVTTLLDPAEREDSISHLRDLTGGNHGTYRAERRAIRKDGKPIWSKNSLTLLRAGGKPSQVFLIAEDVTERRAAFDYIRHHANHDVITSLPNRFQFENRLREVMDRNAAEDAATGLIYMDLDGFKLINDTLGHAAGDNVLKDVADRLTGCLTGSDYLVARLGGDEFAVIVSACTGRNHLAKIAASLLQALDAPFRIGGKDQRVGATIGIALGPEDGAEPEILVRNADEAMYAAKRAGRNRFSFFTAAMRKQAEDRVAIEGNLRQALQRQEFYVVFQPLYDVQSGRLARLEALCRWKSPLLGEIQPAQFIPAAEESGMIVELGNFVLRESCRQGKQWADCGSSAGISVNVSAIQFSRPDFLDIVKSALKESGLDPLRLQLELTESVILKNIDAGVQTIEQLKEIGVKVSIDDFGTGYSSLSYLQKMPVHAVKIDRSFVADVDSNAASVSMIRSVIALARAVGLAVVTEGVETTSQLELLKELGCDEVQGFLLGRPESAEKALARVRNDRWLEIEAAPRELTAA
jgi:diguanylate cyclase (GGDEF)-like protein/PAS domain S-box-containing protein